MVISEQIKTEVKREYDVAVCGGGFVGRKSCFLRGKNFLLQNLRFLLLIW